MMATARTQKLGEMDGAFRVIGRGCGRRRIAFVPMFPG